MLLRNRFLFFLFPFLVLPDSLRAADWPMSRFDAHRSAASPEDLPAKLGLRWSRDLPALEPTWPDQKKLQFDSYDPVVANDLLFLASSRHDWLKAFDADSGHEKWCFFAEGPIRFAPAVWDGKVYVAADDGYLYCLDAANGSLVWKFRGGPSDRKILGNERLISTWPARGGPAIAGGKVYFAASIWPFMGTFIHALDARTGKADWTNDGDGTIFIKQPHGADAFAGVAPQGPLAVSGDSVLVPGGRSAPAAFDRKTGKMLKYLLLENGKRGGGADVVGLGKYFFNGSGVFDIDSHKYLGDIGKSVVLTPEHIFAMSSNTCRALDVSSAQERDTPTVDRLGKKTIVKKWSMKELASCRVADTETLIKAGSRLYTGGEKQVSALDFDPAKGEMTVVWQAEVEGTVVRLAAAGQRLFAVTRQGTVYCFAKPDLPSAAGIPKTTRSAPAPKDEWTAKAEKLLADSQTGDGYAVVLGIGSRRLIDELLAQSKLRLIVMDPDADKVNSLRRHKTDNDLTRLSVLHGEPAKLQLPPYLASLIVSEDWQAAGFDAECGLLAKLYESLRPYGGKACFFSSTVAEKAPDLAARLKLVNADVQKSAQVTLLTRVGALPGAGNWTHEHADASNTRVSKDQIVKAPLGLLWFGGPSNDEVLPRHGHGPQPQVIDGRMLIEGMEMLRCIDIYTGRLLWEADLPGLGDFYNNTAHQPGANSSGGNFVSMPDGIYVAYKSSCLVLDPATGKHLKRFELPSMPDVKGVSRWGYINVHGDYLVGGADPLFDPKSQPLKKPVEVPGKRADDNKDKPTVEEEEKDNPLTKPIKTVKYVNDNMSSSRRLIVMNRHTGAVLWSADAESGFRHNATCIGGGRLYTIDRLSGPQVAKLKRRGEEPKVAPRLFVFDLATGKELWNTRTDVFGTWLSFSAKHDVLIEAGRIASDSLSDEPRGMRAYEARTGKVLWFEKARSGPAMIHGDMILQGQGACDLLTGAIKNRVDPITGVESPWSWTRTYGCNTPAASEHLLTFRSGAAGFFDLCGDSGTGNLGGFRSSCTNNLVVAGGILTAPDYTRTCSCAYQNQTSIAFVHMPEAELWTYFGVKYVKGPVKRLGVNFGAPGDRKDGDSLWIEYPAVGGVSPAIRVKTTPARPEVFRRHSSLVAGKMSWVGASGLKGVDEIAIELGADATPRRYTVRLYFAEPDAVAPGERVFSVHLQNREVAKNLDVVAEAGGSLRTLVKEFRNVEAAGEMVIRLIPSANATLRQPLVSGVEIISEEK